MDWRKELPLMGQMARKAARAMAEAGTGEKNDALLCMAAALRENTADILTANAADLLAAQEAGLSDSLVDRLTLTDTRVESMAKGLEDAAALNDPVGKTLKRWTNSDGLKISQRSVPLGVIAVIYEARPNVTSDAAGLCLKSGNSVILRGGKEARHSNRAIAEVLRRALGQTQLPAEAVQLLDTPDREASISLMQLADIDVLIPRGGKSLKRTVVEQARVPYIMTGMGNCHIFIDESADPEKALEIVINAKCQRPGVCNAVETLLVHRNRAAALLPAILRQLDARGVEIRGDETARALFPKAKAASDEDWSEEYCDLILAVKTVNCLDDAIDHINRYGTMHSESIITENQANAREFQRRVDSAAVYVNASTRFTDGSVFGFGAEIGISTQKLHARGPIGLEHLTSFKYLISGEGQVRR